MEEDPLKYLKLTPEEAKQFIEGARHLFGEPAAPPEDDTSYAVKPEPVIQPGAKPGGLSLKELRAAAGPR